jgi:hypothetical protein
VAARVTRRRLVTGPAPRSLATWAAVVGCASGAISVMFVGNSLPFVVGLCESSDTFKTFCVLLCVPVPFLPVSSLRPSDLNLEASPNLRLCDLKMKIVIFNIQAQQHLHVPE